VNPPCAAFDEILNLQLRGNEAKPSQVEKVRRLVIRTSSEVAMANDRRSEIIIYWSDEDQAFIAEVPELAGCAADGSTYQEALTHAQIAIREWIETASALGRKIPPPQGRLRFA
jgi:predicted RNase H-like HicB family nuclease